MTTPHIRGWLARGALLLLASLIGLEIALWVASTLVSDRSGVWREGAEQRVLCVGDSHTWGAAVEREESYPGQLQRLLDERAPGRYSVLNLGLPGMNTSQVRKRVPAWLDRYDPDTLIVWVGVNNAWNSADFELDDAGWLASLDQRALRSRVYRLIRTRLHDRALEQQGPVAIELVGGRVAELERDDPLLGSVVADHTPVEGRGVWRRAVDDYASISRAATAMQVRTLLVGYPLDINRYAEANVAIATASEKYGIEMLDSPATLAKIPAGEVEWRWALHPGPRVYQEIAQELAERLLAEEGS